MFGVYKSTQLWPSTRYRPKDRRATINDGEKMTCANCKRTYLGTNKCPHCGYLNESRFRGYC